MYLLRFILANISIILGIFQCASPNNKIKLSLDQIDGKSIGILIQNINVKTNILQSDTLIKASLLKEICSELKKHNKNYSITIINNFQHSVIVKRDSIATESLPSVDYLCFIPNADIYRSFPSQHEGSPGIIGGNLLLSAVTASYTLAQPAMSSTLQEIKLTGGYFLIASSSRNILKQGKVAAKDTRSFTSSSGKTFPLDLIAYDIVNQIFTGTPFIDY